MIAPAAFSLAASLLILASIWSWVFALKRLVRRQPLLAYEPRSTPPWNLLDLLMTVFILILLSGLAGTLLGVFTSDQVEAVPQAAAESPDSPPVDSVLTRWRIVLSGVASLIACGLGALMIVIRTGACWGKDLGLTLRHAGRDISYGIVAYVMLAPIIYAIQAALQHWYPSEHPLVEEFRTNPTLGFYLVCVFSAAVAAPLVEEFMCRVLLQGLLERFVEGPSFRQAMFGTADSQLPSRIEPTPALFQPAAPSQATEVVKPEQTPSDERPPEAPGRYSGGLPILISSLVFAALHWGNGLDPIPLFVLALGLGYLYQRTHRILPCVVVHFLVNAFALAMLGMSFFIE
jgi:membrane protease YdiL (CAAX protease family)